MSMAIYVDNHRQNFVIERGCNQYYKRILVKGKALHCEGIKLHVRVS